MLQKQTKQENGNCNMNESKVYSSLYRDPSLTGCRITRVIDNKQ